MQFSLKVLTPRQELAVLTLDATDAQDAASQARALGNVVLSVNNAAQSFIPQFKANRTAFPLLHFSQGLLSLLEAGLSLMEAIQTLQEKEQRPAARQVLDRVMVSLNEGLPLSQALENIQGVFPPLYIALILSSQQTGNLAEALGRYVNYQQQVDMVRKRIVSASIYPAVLAVVGVLVMMFLMLYVVPQFSAIYDADTINLPWMSQLLLGWGQLLQGHRFEAMSIIISLTLLLGYGLTRSATRRSFMELLWRIPAIGERLRIYQLARFYRTLGMLLRGGIPAITALKMVEGLLHANLRMQLGFAIADVSEGKPLSSSLELHGLTTPVAVRMLRVGERSGRMAEMMERTGSFYDDEIALWVDWFTRLFEPILMTGIGLIVGLVVILMYMPIFELASSIQ